ncbi:hypothetical protein [Planctomicrobium piriforme]|uniref:Uncharacterized protein n=1 Tax=Planctomicrobium piriforme TaxID=1576369 RepID=A0A1I3FU93_9PLAN|nr:hypothetical protein [Planctomicrobium piriforme]SFI14810.1 hypothetical protein SAMN05421753_10633 [Planctomicrobium piriforme]
MQMTRRMMLAVTLLAIGLNSTGCKKSNTTTVTFRNQTGVALTINAFVTASGKTYKFNKTNLANGKSTTKKYVTQLAKGSTYAVQGSVKAGATTIPLPAGITVLIGETNTYVISSLGGGMYRASYYINGVFKASIDF